MKTSIFAFFGVIAFLLTLIPGNVLAEDTSKAFVAASGYDVVSYHSKTGPVRGYGWNVSEYGGATYLFVNKDNKETFDANPDKYVPAYGGYCAYGVAVGKKFYTDPLSWHIEGGKLYLNLDKSIQEKWLKDVPGHIAKSEKNWMQIKDKAPAEL